MSVAILLLQRLSSYGSFCICCRIASGFNFCSFNFHFLESIYHIWLQISGYLSNYLSIIAVPGMVRGRPFRTPPQLSHPPVKWVHRDCTEISGKKFLGTPAAADPDRTANPNPKTQNPKRAPLPRAEARTLIATRTTKNTSNSWGMRCRVATRD